MLNKNKYNILNAFTLLCNKYISNYYFVNSKLRNTLELSK